MSYILDALRQAEKDRQLGKTPSPADLTPDNAPPPAPTRPGTRIWLLALFAAIALAWIYWPRSWLEQPAPAEAEAVADFITQPTAAPSASASAEATLPATPDQGTQQDTATLALQLDTDLQQDLLAELRQFADAAIGRGTDLTHLSDLTDPAAQQAVPAPPPPSHAKPKPAAAEPTPSPPASQPPVETPAPLLRDMPAGFRNRFPPVNVQVHVFDALAQNRWIMVENQRYAEGDVLSVGPRIDQIARDGLVLMYRGETVFIPLN